MLLLLTFWMFTLIFCLCFILHELHSSLSPESSRDNKFLHLKMQTGDVLCNWSKRKVDVCVLWRKFLFIKPLIKVNDKDCIYMERNLRIMFELPKGMIFVSIRLFSGWQEFLTRYLFVLFGIFSNWPPKQ